MNGNATPEQLAQLIAERFDYDRLADAIASRLEHGESPGLLCAKEIAARLGRSPRWVREHKAELGAVPLSDGPRPRLGFDPARVDRALASRRFGL